MVGGWISLSTPLRLLAIQTSTEVTSEVNVFRTLLESLSQTARAGNVMLEVLLLQGVDGRAGNDGRQAAEVFRSIPEVTVCPFDVGKLGRSDTTRVQRLAKIRDVTAVQLARPRLLSAARRFQPDLVYSAQQRWDLRIATPIARALGCPQVVHLHYTVGPYLGRGMIDTLRGAAMVIAISAYIRDDAIRNGTPAEQVSLVYNSTPIPPRPTSRDEARHVLRDELGFPANALLIGMVARLTENKGQEHLIQAVLPILRADSRTHLLLVGTEDPRPRGITERIRETARQHSVISQVHLLGHRRDVPRILDGLDIFAHPSRFEPFSLSILEAMAHGLPVVAWREGGPAEIVADGQTGFLVEPMDIDGLTAALRSLLDDKCLRATFGTRGRERVEATFSPETAASAFVAALITTSRANDNSQDKQVR